MPRRAFARHHEHHRTQQQGDGQQRAGQRQVDRPDEADRQQHPDGGRHDVPRAGILQREGGVGGGGDPAGQRTRQPFGEIAWRVAGEVAEQVAPDVRSLQVQFNVFI